MTKDVLIVGSATYDALKASAMKELADNGHVVLDPVFVNKTADAGKTEQPEAVLLRQSGGQIAEALGLTETISEFPDRLCIEHKSRFFSTSCAHVGVRVSHGGSEPVESNDIIEYCKSGRWIRLGKRDMGGNLVRHRTGFETTRLENVDIELYWRYGPSRQVRRALKRVGA